MGKLAELLRIKDTRRRFGLWVGVLILIAGLGLPAASKGAGSWPVLVGVLGLGVLIWKRARFRREQQDSPACLRRRDSMKLGGQQVLHLLQVDGRNLLVACSADKVALLDRWEEPKGCRDVVQEGS